MNRPLPALLLGLWATVPLALSQQPPHAVPESPIDLAEFMELEDPEMDPYRIINESMNFRKDREPDMTAAEFALYERVSTMAETNPDFALNLLETMLADEEEDSAAFDVALGNLYFAEGRFEEAMTRYQSAVKKYPEFLRAWGNIGTLHYQEENWRDAAKAYARAVNLGDRDAQTFGLLAFCLKQSGNTLGAEMAFQQAMTANPEDPNWVGGLLELYIANERLAPAETLVRELVRLEPQNANHWMLYANLLLRLKRPLEAATQLELARSLGASSSASLGLLGDLYLNQGLVREAVAIYGELPDNAQAGGQARLIAYARALIDEGDIGAAELILEELPTFTSWEHQRARLFATAELAGARGAWEDAATAYTDILSTEPLNGYALLGLGHAHNEQGQLARARLAFESALQVTESRHRAHLELANLELRFEDLVAALGHLREADAIESSAAIRTQIARLSLLAAPTKR